MWRAISTDWTLIFRAYSMLNIRSYPMVRCIQLQSETAVATSHFGTFGRVCPNVGQAHPAQIIKLFYFILNCFVLSAQIRRINIITFIIQRGGNMCAEICCIF